MLGAGLTSNASMPIRSHVIRRSVSVSLRRGCGSTISQGLLPSRTTTTDGILPDGSLALISGLAQGVPTNIASSTPGKADGQAEQ